MAGNTRGQSGLDRLVIFVLLLVAVVFVTPFVLGLGGIDVQGADTNESALTPTNSDRDAGVFVLEASGETRDSSVTVVRVVVTKDGSGRPIDAGRLSATWIGNGSYTLAANESGTRADGTFGVTGSGNGTVLNQSGDRATLVFDLGTDDVDGVEEFGRPLSGGEAVTLLLATESGETTTVTLHVPGSLDDGETVAL